MEEKDAIKKFPRRRNFIKSLYKQEYIIINPEELEKIDGMTVLAHVHGMNPFDKKKEDNMACKLRCPKCHKTLKEEGDMSKDEQNEYRVYDNVENCEVPQGSRRLIECLACGYIGNISENWGN